ncbi:MAG: asparagine synthase (glutamine-hydrolyzing) [Chloroflexi bacterium]|nr:asparagine synthase (glutamine-hydrolyzing) [Chloroflexota bacterium]
MCGICGKVNFNQSPPISMEELNFMCEKILHRGPDGTKKMIREKIAFGHTRLSIIDLESGWQPISNESNNIFTILNGEIYNYQQLRTKLTKLGYKFKTQSDTETIVHMYEEYGEDFIQYIDGMFAIAIWDEREEKLILYRDRFGKKPLFYYHSNNELYFSSEIKSFPKKIIHSTRINLRAIYEYLNLGYIPSSMSIYEKIYKLEPAHYLVLKKNNIKVEKYWHFEPKTNNSLKSEEIEETVNNLLEKSVKSRLISDVPLGFFLSGGLDSSIVVATASKFTDKINTFSIGFEDKTYNELSYAKLVSKKFNTKHEEFIISPNIIKDIEKIIWFADEPFADASMLPFYYLSQMTSKHVTVSLSGDGADEIFGGYERYIGKRIAKNYYKIPYIFRKSIAKFTKNIIENFEKNNKIRKIKRLSYPAYKNHEEWYLSFLKQFNINSKNIHENKFLTKDFINKINIDIKEENDYLIHTLNEIKNNKYNNEIQILDIMTYLPGDILFKSDRMSMANGLEVRSPFLDKDLVEYSMSIPQHFLFDKNKGKQPLRKIFKDKLPSEILSRSKEGFSVPIAKWIKDDLKEMFSDKLLSNDARIHSIVNKREIKSMLDQHYNNNVDFSVKLWNLFCLELWTEGNNANI